MDRLRFGPAGIPLSSPVRSTIEGIKWVKHLGLDAMEMEFVRGVNMSLAKAEEARRVSKSLDVTLTAHAPYYINLNSSDPSKVKASIRRIYETAKITWAAGGYSIVFHPAYYGGELAEKVYPWVKDALREVISKLKDEGIEIWVRPETMGKVSQFGSLEEVIKLSEEIEMVLPCVDFAHLHARSRGKMNSHEEFAGILQLIEDRLGREALDNMHIHFSGIEYGEKGERKHLVLRESDMDYEALLKTWNDFNLKGVAICESPNLEEDALFAKTLYETL